MIDIWHGLLYLFAHMYDAVVTTMLYRSVILYYLSPAVVSVRICCAVCSLYTIAVGVLEPDALDA